MRSLVPCLLLLACETVPVVKKDPVPPAERLQRGDCALAAGLYTQRRPSRSQPSVDDFRRFCEERLAGVARRVVLRCWADADSSASFLGCNDRF